jgi:protein SCO1/2
VVAAAAALAALGGAMSACSSDDAQASDLHGTVVPPPPFKVDGTMLEDTDGKPFSLTESTDKRLTLVFFGYTNCPDICPAVMANLASAMTRLDEADRDQVQVVFVTTDPERDTPEVLRAYLDRYDKSFVGVTGSLDDIAKVGLSIGVGLGTKLPSGGYEVDAHTTQTTAIDVDDQAPIFWGQTTSSADFAADIHTLLGG